VAPGGRLGAYVELEIGGDHAVLLDRVDVSSEPVHRRIDVLRVLGMLTPQRRVGAPAGRPVR
jgi:hypothetical protein